MKYIIALCFLACTAANTLKGTRIVGGEETTIEEYPYNAVLMKKGTFTCSASILSENWALTASHCIDHNYEYAIKAGVTGRTEDVKVWKASKVITHPEFDITLLHMEEPLPLDGKKMKAVKLPDAEPKIGELITVSGWGEVESGDYLNNLRYVVIPVEDRKQCWNGQLRPQEICIGSKEGGKGSCFGDSGGPAVDQNGYQIGVVIAGSEPCAQAGLSSILINVGHKDIRDFITNHTSL